MIKDIDDMTEEDWERICVRCGKCCYYKYLIDETNELEYGEVCEFLDEETRLCTCYETRSVDKPDCLKLSPENFEENAWWLPEDCAYRKKLKTLKSRKK